MNVETLDASVDDLSQPDRVLQLGLPPQRIDVMTDISGVEFDEAWGSKVIQAVGSLDVPFLSRADLVRNKKAAGRTRDLADLEDLGEID